MYIICKHTKGVFVYPSSAVMRYPADCHELDLIQLNCDSQTNNLFICDCRQPGHDNRGHMSNFLTYKQLCVLVFLSR